MIEPKKTSRSGTKFGTRGAWRAEADHMRAHQGDTFIIERRPHPNKAAYALAAHVRSGGYVAFRPAGAFDAWVEREGANLEVVAVCVGEGTHAPGAAETVASTPPGVDPADSDGEADSATAFRARLEALPPEDRADAVVAWVGAMPLERRKAVISAWVSDYLAEETGESVYDLLDELRVPLGETAQDSDGEADDVLIGTVVEAKTMPPWATEPEDDVDLYALSEDELRSHLESLATPELYAIMESMGMSSFFANRIDVLGVIETKVHYAKAGAASTPAPDPAEAVAVTAGPAHPIGSQLYRQGYPPVQVVKVTAKSVFVNNGGRDFRLDRARLEENGFALVHDFKYSGDYTALYADEAARDADSPAAGDPQPARPKRTVAVRAIDPESEAETVTPPEPAYPVGSVLYGSRGPMEVSKVTAKFVFLDGCFRVSRAELEAHGRVWHGSLGWVDPEPRVVGGGRVPLVDPVAL